jgi:hypothetical protein
MDRMRQVLSRSSRMPLRTRWRDDRIQSLLNIYQRFFGIDSGCIHVSRGQVASTSGYDIASPPTSGFISGQQWNEVQGRFPDRPVPVLRKQKGEKEKGWGGHPFFAPTLIVPTTGHAFLFVRDRN